MALSPEREPYRLSELSLEGQLEQRVKWNSRLLSPK